MENFDQIESNILNKIKNVNDRNSLDSVKTEIFGKKGVITELFKKLEAWIKVKEKNMLQNLMILKQK